MRNDIKPVYEEEDNQKGGALSVRVHEKYVWRTFVSCCSHVFCDQLLNPNYDPSDVNGIVFAPKKGNTTIQIWLKNRVVDEECEQIISPIVMT